MQIPQCPSVTSFVKKAKHFVASNFLKVVKLLVKHMMFSTQIWSKWLQVLISVDIALMNVSLRYHCRYMWSWSGWTHPSPRYFPSLQQVAVIWKSHEAARKSNTTSYSCRIYQLTKYRERKSLSHQRRYKNITTGPERLLCFARDDKSRHSKGNALLRVFYIRNVIRLALFSVDVMSYQQSCGIRYQASS